MRHASLEPKQARKNGKDQWVVYIPKHMGGGRRFFSDRAEAEKHSDKLGRSRSNIASRFLSMRVEDQAAIISALDSAGSVADLCEGARLVEARRNIKSITVEAAVSECLVEKRRSGLRLRSLQNLECSLGHFSDFIAPRTMLSEVSRDDIKLWLDAHGWSAATRKSRLTDVRTLFSWAFKLRKILDNPAMTVETPRLDDSEPQILTVDEVRKLMEAIEKVDVGLVGYVAPILFGGLRPNESANASAPVDWVLSVGSPGTKGRKRRLIEVKGTLKSWLSLTGVEYSPRNLAKRMRAVRKEAGIPWPHDCLRHSFCSYAYPILGASRTAAMANHTEQILFTNYRAVVTEAEARRFWEVKPTSES